MGVVRGGVLRARWVVLVQLVGFALLMSACDMSGPLASATATLPGNVPDEGINLPDDLLTPIPGTVSLTPTAVPADVSGDDRDAIYGLVVLNLVKDEQASTVYIGPFAGEGEQLDTSNNQLPLSATLDDTLKLVDPERDYRMADFSEVVGALEDGGQVEDRGVFITLGRLASDPEGPDIVAVRGSIYRGLSDAEGNLYRFRRDDTAPDGWKLLDVKQEWSEKR